MAKIAFLFFAACVVPATCSQSTANPIRKVVTLLQKLQKDVEAEGEKQENLYNKFQCYCKTSGGDLQGSIDSANIEVPQVASDIKESESKKAQLDDDLTGHRDDRQAAKEAIAQATSIREKAAAAYAATKAEADSNIGALSKAIPALEKGMSGFLQTQGAQIIKKLVLSRGTMAEVDRQDVLSFLSGGVDGQYAPASGQIVGILKELKDQMTKDINDATGEETSSIGDHEALVASKNKEIQALTSAIETKTQRTGELAVGIVQMKNSLDDTQASLLDDQKFLADLDKNCATKAQEWEVIQKTRSEELLALADTIKILNDDDALDLFGKTLDNKASLLQLTDSVKARKARALAILSKVPNKPGVDFISLALHGKQQGFEKVLKMIDEMVVQLKQEQVDDDDKKEYCNIQFDSSDDKKKGLERKVSDLEAAIAETEDGIAKSKENIAAKTASVAALDKHVAEASAQRKSENADFTELMASNTAAKQLIGIAKNRMNKFYNPKLYKPPPARELTEEERIFQASGGTLDPTPAPGGIAGTGVLAFVQVRSVDAGAPPPPPETFGAYKKKGEQSNGVIGMLDLLVKDLDKEMQEAQVEEKNAQEEYESMMSDSAAKRTADAKSITDTTAQKASLEEDYQTATDDKKSTTAELMATEKYISTLHGECDWLVKYYDARKEARAGEVDSLANAKAVLSGADYALIQSGSLRGTRRH